MSFFGFDTTLPGGNSLDERLRRMAEADENLQVYDFDDGGLEGLATSGLDDTLDAFNDDTFGLGGDVGKDFDFSGNTAQYLGDSGTKAPAKSNDFPGKSGSPFGFAAFDADPLLGPVRPSSNLGRTSQQQTPTTKQAPYTPNAQPQGASSTPPVPYGPTTAAPKPKVRTLEEIEAELQAKARSTPPAMIQAQAPPQQPHRMTVEEVEAEMMRQAQLRQAQANQQQQQAQQYAKAAQHSVEQVQVLAQQAQQLALRQQQQGQPLQSPQRQPFAPVQPTAGLAGQDMLAQLFPSLPNQQPASGTDNQGLSLADPNLAQNVEARIKQHEELENQRRRKAMKIHRMAKYNNLMTQGDKDFITRIQVSQLINSNGPNGNHDPYYDDFYFSVMTSLRNSRLQQAQAQMQAQAQSAAQGQAGPIPGPADGSQQNQQQHRGGRKVPLREMGNNNQKMTRRENAMNRMAQQVQRIVDDAKKKPRATQLSLEGALGKIAIRTRSAPRPLLQVDSKKDDTEGSNSTAAAAAASLSSSLNTSSATHAALNRRQILVALEKVYDIVLQLEQSRRVESSLIAQAQTEEQAEAAGAFGEDGQPRKDARLALQEHQQKYKELVDQMWTGIKVMEPLDISTPHPFISLLSATKGKKLLPRVLRHTDQQQTLTLLTLLVATFDTLDVVRDAPILDTNPNDPLLIKSNKLLGTLQGAEGKKTRKMVEVETETFLNSAIPLVMSTIGRAPLRIVTGMLGLLIERNDLLKLAKTKPGLAFLTLFLSRAEILKSNTTATAENPVAEPSELEQWSHTFRHLVQRLSGHLVSLFPSSRSAPFGAQLYAAQFGNAASMQNEMLLDIEDEPVWHFLAALAVSSDMQQQQYLVSEVREKVLENVQKAKLMLRNVPEGVDRDEVLKGNPKIRNVNTFLHALGLDASQITIE